MADPSITSPTTELEREMIYFDLVIYHTILFYSYPRKVLFGDCLLWRDEPGSGNEETSYIGVNAKEADQTKKVEKLQRQNIYSTGLSRGSDIL